MQNGPKSTVAGRLIGYARVSTEDQGTDPQRDELLGAGCATVHEEHASGADRSRPVLAHLLRDIRPGETLVVVRLDRLARSVSHLLVVIDPRRARHAHFEHDVSAMVEPLGRVVTVSQAQNVPDEVVGQEVVARRNPPEPG